MPFPVCKQGNHPSQTKRKLAGYLPLASDPRKLQPLGEIWQLHLSKKQKPKKNARAQRKTRTGASCPVSGRPETRHSARLAGALQLPGLRRGRGGRGGGELGALAASVGVRGGRRRVGGGVGVGPGAPRRLGKAGHRWGTPKSHPSMSLWRVAVWCSGVSHSPRVFGGADQLAKWFGLVWWKGRPSIALEPEVQIPKPPIQTSN